MYMHIYIYICIYIYMYICRLAEPAPLAQRLPARPVWPPPGPGYSMITASTCSNLNTHYYYYCCDYYY